MFSPNRSCMIACGSVKVVGGGLCLALGGLGFKSNGLTLSFRNSAAPYAPNAPLLLGGLPKWEQTSILVGMNCEPARKEASLQYHGHSMTTQVRKVHWSLWQDCNMQCSFCYLWRPKRHGLVEGPHAESMVSQIAASSVEWLVFAGGDPLIRGDLPNLLRKAKGVGLRTDLQTNALLASSVDLESLTPYLDRVGLSLDGESASVHDAMRMCPGHFRIVLDTLSRCDRLGIPVTIRTLVSRANRGRIARLADVLQDHGSVQKWSLREFVPLGKGAAASRAFRMSPKDFHHEVEQIVKQSRKLRIGPRISVVTRAKMEKCYCMITPFGDVYTYQSSVGYMSKGKFPEESMAEILAKVDYDSSLREARDSELGRVNALT